jgi:hypothetical protein
LRFFLKKTPEKGSQPFETSLAEPPETQEPTLATVASAGVVDYGASSPSISNGWPGPQPVTKNRIATAKISRIVVLAMLFLRRSIRRFLLEDTVSP